MHMNRSISKRGNGDGTRHEQNEGNIQEEKFNLSLMMHKIDHNNTNNNKMEELLQNQV